MKYVGLTDDPESRKTAHGNPPDWWQRSFSSEQEARRWEKEMLAKPGYKGGLGEQGWNALTGRDDEDSLLHPHGFREP